MGRGTPEWQKACTRRREVRCIPPRAPLNAGQRGPEPLTGALGIAAWRRCPHPTPRAWCNTQWVMWRSRGGSSMPCWVCEGVGDTRPPCPQAQEAGYTWCTSVGASKGGPEPGWPVRAPRVPEDGCRSRFCVQGESEDGGVLEVGEVVLSCPGSVASWCCSWSTRCCRVKRCSWTADGVCSQSCCAKGKGP
jgi:hypothetical protein